MKRVQLMKTMACLFLLGFTPIGGLYAQSSSEVDVGDIRAPESVKPVTVLQNRFFIKQYRPEVGILVGTFMKEAYLNMSSYGVRSALYMNEWLGFEAQYIKVNIKDSEDRKAVRQIRYEKDGETKFVDPYVNEIKKIVDFNVVLTPFYGKLNMMDLLILYSDLYIDVGITAVDSSQGEIIGGIIGVGERFYWKKSLALRVDFRNRIYSEKRYTSQEMITYSEVTKNSYYIDFGISYFLM